MTRVHFRAAAESGANLQEETDASSQADQLLTRSIKSVVEKTGSRLFLVHRNDRYALNGAIEELIEKRIIDPYSRADVDPDIRTKYDAFVVRYGLWLDWRPVDMSQEEYEQRELPDVCANDAEWLRIHVGTVDSDTLKCPHCGGHFRSTARPYVIAGLCPNCYQRQEIVSGSSGDTSSSTGTQAARVAA